MTKPDMKPCPFCGGDKNTICKTDYDGRDSFAVSCRYPVCHGAIFMLGYGYFPTADQAIAAWNTRAVDPATIREGIGMTDAPEQIFASSDSEDGWRWPRASKFPEQGMYDNIRYTRSDLVDPAAIREAALREAAAAVSKLADHAVTALAYEHAHACRDEILALIGEKT